MAVNYKSLLCLDNRTFIVLGAGDGIGMQVSIALSQCGGRVVCVDSSAERAKTVASAVGGIAVTADITRREDLEHVFAQAAQLPGGGPLGVVDVVGMVVRNSLASADDAGWKRQFELVLDHAWLALQLGAQTMNGRGGSFVFIGSIAGNVVRGGPALAYSAAKAGLHHLVRGAALDLAPAGIRVNVVAPGLTKTPRLVQSNPPDFWTSQAAQIPMRRVGEIPDVASAVLFLASPMASYITGTVVPVDGGSSLSSGSFSLAKSEPGAP